MYSITRCALLGVALLSVACTSQQDRPVADTSSSQQLPVASGADTALSSATEVIPAAVDSITPQESVRSVESDGLAASSSDPATPFDVPAPTTTDGGNSVTTQEVGSEVSVGELRADTRLAMAFTEDVCTNSHKPGDEVHARTSQAVTGTYGANIPEGSDVVFALDTIKRSENVRDAVEIVLSPRYVDVSGAHVPVEGSIEGLQVEVRRQSAKKRSGFGALLGGVLAGAGAAAAGKTKEEVAAIAAAGATAGAAAGYATANAEGCVRTTAPFTFRLTKAVELKGK